MCSGKVYYDLYEEREKRGINDIYLLRVEQLYPFPAKALITELSRFRNAEMVWCQEEPKNMGAWSFIDPYLEWVLAHIDAKHQRVRYTGRPAAASPATGLMSKHLAQLAASSTTRSANSGRSQHERIRHTVQEQWLPKSAFPLLANPSPRRRSANGSRRSATPSRRRAAGRARNRQGDDRSAGAAAGTLAEITAKEGETVGVGALLGQIGEAVAPSRRRRSRPSRRRSREAVRRQPARGA